MTCIIDWGSAVIARITELLATPGLEGSTSLPSRPRTGAFRSCFEPRVAEIDPDEWKKAERIRHFSRLVRLLPKQHYNLFTALNDFVYKTENEGPGGSVDYA